jgi:undecaprenyl diphosphate synthase
MGIIMDGNRRFAKAHGLPSLEGHRGGFEKAREVAEWAFGAGVEELILYAFSTENWNRAPEEVAYLLELFSSAFEKGLEPLIESGVRVRFLGALERFPEPLRQHMRDMKARSVAGRRGTLAIALSYGGRAELVAAANRLRAADGPIDEAALAGALWTAGMRDPDLILRTGGESRLSNFLLRQSAYSELFFTDTLWPDLGREELGSILAAYAARERRHGK